MVDIEIFKELNKKYKQLMNQFEILMISLYAPKEYIAIVIPSVEDILKSNDNFTYDVTIGNNCITCYSLRYFCNTFPKVMFKSLYKYKYRIINRKYKDILKKQLDVDMDKLDLNNVVFALYQYHITQDILKVNLPDKDIDLDKYKNVFVISDTHFGHINILKYEDRVNQMGVNSIEEHDTYLISNWNNVVDKNDLVIILGDFSFRKANGTMDLLSQLNGDKMLIKGNHDMFLNDKTFDKSLFIGVYDYLEIKYKGQELVLMHYPIQSFKHQNREVKPAVLLFGHIHSNYCSLPKHSFNVGVDVNDYTPINIKYAIEKAKSNVGGIFNGKL